MGSVWCAHSTVLTAAKSEPVGGEGGEEDKLTGLPGILSVCSTLCIELSSDANPNDIGPVGTKGEIRSLARFPRRFCR